VAYYRSDYSAQSLGELMNELARVADGVLLPPILAAGLDLAPGDLLPVNAFLEKDTPFRTEFTVVGSFDYFPTMQNGQQVLVATWIIWRRLPEGHAARDLAAARC